MRDGRVAVLVDGDNVSARYAEDILSMAAAAGRVDLARVYAAMNRPTDWVGRAGFRLMHAGAGKNAADLLLSIDAMELALVAGFDAFVIATSDGDFTHLAQRLRERGLRVLGMGESKAPADFRMACGEFRALDGPAPDPAPTARAPTPPIARSLDEKIRDLIAEHSTQGRGMRLAELSAKMHSRHGTRIGTFPEKTWRAYFVARPAQFELDPRGPDAMVRFLPRSFD